MFTSTNRIINLDPDFNFFYGHQTSPTLIDFPSGCEPHVKLTEIGVDAAVITCRIQKMDDLMRLFLLTDALRRNGTKDIGVFIPYLPFARQDRVMTEGEPLSIKVFANLINSQNYSHVLVFDPHSEVTPALINNCMVMNNYKFVNHTMKYHLATMEQKMNEQQFYFVSPDAGAFKKIFSLCEFLGYKDEIILCNKVRDLNKKGVIRSVTVSKTDLEGKDCIIVDDICDGGGTFNLLASELKQRNAGNIYLIVSHGIFSKGTHVFPDIQRIYCSDSFKTIEPDLKVTQIKLKNTSA